MSPAFVIALVAGRKAVASRCILSFPRTSTITRLFLSCGTPTLALGQRCHQARICPGSRVASDSGTSQVSLGGGENGTMKYPFAAYASASANLHILHFPFRAPIGAHSLLARA